MYTIEFESNVDGQEKIFVDEFSLVEKVLSIKEAFRRAGYSASGSFHKTARRFFGEYEFRSNAETVKMAIV